MTIVFQGHVARVENGFGNSIDVHVQTAQAECGQVVVLHVPQANASHWLPGRAVQFTAFAFDAPEPSNSASLQELLRVKPQLFKAQRADFDRVGRWVVLTSSDGEWIAACKTASAANELETALNLAVAKWMVEDEPNRTVNDAWQP